MISGEYDDSGLKQIGLKTVKQNIKRVEVVADLSDPHPSHRWRSVHMRAGAHVCHSGVVDGRCRRRRHNSGLVQGGGE